MKRDAQGGKNVSGSSPARYASRGTRVQAISRRTIMNHAGEPVGSRERRDWFSDECRATEWARPNRDYIPKQGLLFAHVLFLVLFLVVRLAAGHTRYDAVAPKTTL